MTVSRQLIIYKVVPVLHTAVVLAQPDRGAEGVHNIHRNPSAQRSQRRYSHLVSWRSTGRAAKAMHDCRYAMRLQ